jgi:hypothetical protein
MQNMNNDLKNAASKIMQQQAELAEKDDKLSAANRAMADFARAKSQYEQNIVELQNDNKDLTRQLKEKAAIGSDDPNEQRIRFEGIISDNKKFIDDLRSQIRNKDQELSQARDKIARAEEKLRNLEDQNSQLERNVNAKDDQYRSAIQQSTDLREEQAREFAKKLDELNREIKDKDNKIKDRDTKLRDFEGTIAELNNSIRDKDFSSKGLETQLKKKDDSIKDLEQKLLDSIDQLTQAKTQHQIEVSDANRKANEFSRQLQDSKKQNEALTSQIKDLQSSISEQNDSRANQLTQDLDKARQALSKAQDQSKQFETAYKSLLPQLSDSMNQIDSLKSLNEGLKRTIDSDKTDQGSLLKQISDLQSELGEKDVKLKSLLVDSRNLQSELDRLRKDQDKSSERFGTLSASESFLKDELKGRLEDLKKLKDESDASRKANDILRSENERLNDTVARLKDNLEKLNVDYSDQSKSLKEFKDKLRDANRLNESVRSELEGAKRGSSDSQTQISKLKDQIATLRESEGNLRKKLEEQRQKTELAEKLGKTLEVEFKNKILEKDRQIKNLDQALSREKENWLEKSKQQRQAVTSDLEEQEIYYRNQIEDMNDEILRLKEEHMRDLEDMTEKQLRELKDIILRNNEAMRRIKEESDAETTRVTRRIEELLNRMKDGSEKAEGLNLDEILQLKFDQERATLLRNYRAETDTLQEQKQELQQEIDRLLRELARLRELNEDLKTRLRLGAGSPSVGNSRTGSINMIRQQTQTGVSEDQKPKSGRSSRIPSPDSRTRRHKEGQGDPKSQREKGKQDLVFQYNVSFGPEDEEEMEIVHQDHGDNHVVHVAPTTGTPNSVQNRRQIDQAHDRQATPDNRRVDIGNMDAWRGQNVGGFSPQSGVTPQDRSGWVGQGDSVPMTIPGTSPTQSQGFAVVPKPAPAGAMKKNQTYLQTLTTLRKARILDNALRHILSNLKTKAFYRLVASNLFRLRGWGEAGTRVKGRLMLLLKTRYADSGVRRSFLRWAMLSKPNFVRDCVVKIALTSKLTDHSVFWRFRKIIQKKIKGKIPDSAKSARFVLGSHLLHFLCKMKSLRWRIVSMNQMRIDVVGKENRLLINILNKRNSEDRLSQLRALKKLRAFSICKEVALERFCRYLQGKAEAALSKMRIYGVTKRIVKEQFSLAEDMLFMIGSLKGAASKNINKALDLGRLDKLKLRSELLKKFLRVAMENEESSALNRLRSWASNENQREARRKRLLRRVFLSLQEKSRMRSIAAFETLRNLGHTKTLVNRVKMIQTEKIEKVTKITTRTCLHKLLNAQKGKIQISYFTLVRNSLSISASADKKLADLKRREQMRAKTLNRLFANQTRKRDSAFSRLVDRCRAITNSSQFKSKKMASLLTKLSAAQKGKCRSALTSLRIHKNQLLAVDKLHKDLKGKNDRMKNRIISKLIANSTKKVASSISKLRQLNKDAEDKLKRRRGLTTKVFNRIEAASALKTRYAFSELVQNWLQDIAAKNNVEQKDKKAKLAVKKILYGIIRTQANKMNDSFKKLVKFNKDLADKKNAFDRKAKSALNRLYRAQDSKLDQAFGALRDNKRFEIDRERSTTAEVDKNRTRQQRILSKLFKAVQRKIDDSFENMVSFAREEKLKKDLRDRRILWLLSKLAVAQEVKARITLSNLRGVRLEGEAQDVKEKQNERVRKEAIKSLISNLLRTTQNKFAQALDRLILFNKRVYSIDIGKQTKVSNALNRLVSSSQSKMRISIYELKQFKAQQELEDDRVKVINQRNMIITKRVITNLLRNLTYKTRSAFNELTDFAKEYSRKRDRIRRGFNNLMNQISRACDQKQRFVINHLIQMRLSGLAEKDRLDEADRRTDRVKNRSVTKIMKSGESKLKDALRKLLDNSEDAKRIEKQRRKLITEICTKTTRSQLIKIRIAWSDLIQHGLESRGAEDRERGQKERERVLKQNLINKLGQSLNRLITIAVDKLLVNSKTSIHSSVSKRGQLSNALNKLAAASQTKCRIALFQLVQMNISTKADEDKEKIATQKRNLIISRLLNKVLLNQGRKIKSTLDNLIRSCAEDQKREKALKSALNDLVSRTSRAFDIKLRLAFTNFIQNRISTMAENDKMEEMEKQDGRNKTRIVRRVGGSYDTKLRDAFRRLIENAGERALEEKHRKGKLSDICTKTILSQIIKTRIAWSDLIQHGLEMKGEEEKEKAREAKDNSLLKRLVQRLVTSSRSIQAMTLHTLRNLPFKIAQAEARKQSTNSKALNRLPTASNLKTRVALNLLIQNSLQKGQDAFIKNRALQKLVGAYITKSDLALQKLRAHNLQTEKAASQRRRRLTIMVNKFSASTIVKLRTGFNDLVQHNIEAIGEEEREKAANEKDQTLRRRLINKLVGSLDRQTTLAYERLRDRTEAKGSIDLHKNRRMASLLNRLVFASMVKARIAYNLLCQNNYEIQKEDDIQKLNADKTRLIRTKTVTKMVTTYTRLLGSAYERMVDFGQTVNMIDKHRKRTDNAFISKLIAAQNLKQAQCLNKLLSHRKDMIQRDKQILSALCRLVTCSNSKMRQAILELEKNSMESRNYEGNSFLVTQNITNLKNRLVSRFVQSYQRKTEQALIKLNENSVLFSKLNDRARRVLTNIFIKLISSSYLKSRIGFTQLNQNRIERAARQGVETEREIREKIQKQRFINKIVPGNIGKLSDAFRLLKKNAEEQESKGQNWRSKIQPLLSKLRGALKQKQIQTLNQLMHINKTTNAEKLADEQYQNRRRSVITRTITQISRTTITKIRDSFDRLKEHYSQQANLSGYRTSRIRNLVTRIVTVSSVKLSRGFDRLRGNAANAGTTNSRLAFAVNRLGSRLNSKVRDAIDKLRQHSFRNQSLSIALNFKFSAFTKRMMDKATLSREQNIKYCLYKLSRYAQNERGKQNKKSSTLANLIRSQNFKTKESLQKLKNHNIYTWGETRLNETLMENTVDREMRIKNRAFKRIYHSSLQKCIYTLRSLKYMNDDYDKLSNKKFIMVSGIINRINRQSELNKQLVMQKFKMYSMRIRGEKDRVRKAIARLINKMSTNRRGDLVQGLGALKKNKLYQDQLNGRRSSTLQSIISRMNRANNSKSDQALNKLKKITEKDLELKKRKERALNRINQGLVKGSGGKLSQVIHKLSHYKTKETSSKIFLSTYLRTLVRRINASSKSKLSDALNRLLANKLSQDRRIKERVIATKIVGGHASSWGTREAKNALNKLRANRIDRDRRAAELIRAIRQTTSRMTKANNSKLKQALEELRSNANFNRLQNVRRDYLTRRLLERLRSAQTNKISQSFYKAKDYSAQLSGTGQRRKYLTSLLARRLHSAQTAKVRQASDLLQTNLLVVRIEIYIKKVLVKEVVHFSDLKQLSSLYKMQMNRISETLKSKLKKAYLSSIISNFRRKLLDQAETKLKKNAYDRLKVARTMWRRNERLREEFYRAAWRKLTTRTVVKKRSFGDRLTRIIHRLETRIHTVQRTTIQKWQQQTKSAREVHIRAASLFDALLRVRLQYALDRIYNKSELVGFEIRQKAVRDMASTIEAARFKQRAETFYNLKQRFHQPNPWFKKVIYIWTQRNHLDKNIAFWRIRYEKVLGFSSVETAKAVKLKAMLKIFLQKEMKWKASSFSAINYSSLNLSFQAQKDHQFKSSINQEPLLRSAHRNSIKRSRGSISPAPKSHSKEKYENPNLFTSEFLEYDPLQG